MCVTVSWLSPMTFWSLGWLPSNLTMTTRLLMYCTDTRVSSNLTLGNRVNEHERDFVPISPLYVVES